MQGLMNQMYYNPQYRAPYYSQNVQSGYQAPVDQFQQQAPVYAPQGIQMYGKIVQNVESITANDVPMDGSVAYFPKQDMTEIYAKSWGADGKIRTRIYRPISDDTNILPGESEKPKFDLSEKATEGIMKRFDELSQKIEQLEESMTNSMAKKPVPKTKTIKDGGEAE